jgi:DNA polymerase
MTFEGLTATPDHLIWNGYRFIPFEYYAAMRDNANGGRNIFYSGLRPVYDIKNCGSRHRFMVSGHIVHNCGYGGASGALIAMGALDMGLHEAELPDLIKDWRTSNPRIVQFWWDIDKAATNTVKAGNLNRVGLITFERYAGELFITLPSGRKLAYASPRLEPNKFGRMGITYMGIGTNNKWQRLETYGPKIVENIVQATARDLLAEAMLRVRNAGYEIVLHVHDEMCVEVVKGTLSIDELCSLMSVNPSWAEGLPLNADGYTCPYYQKR